MTLAKFDYGRFGAVSIQRSSTPPRDVVLFFIR